MENIRLNFLRITPDSFSFTVFRALVADSSSSAPPASHRYRLPRLEGDADYLLWDVTFVPTPGFETFSCDSRMQPHLTNAYVYRLLDERAHAVLGPAALKEGRDFYRRVTIVTATHDVGQETIWLEPYYLYAARAFGLLLDFHFVKAPDAPFDKRIQQLSLSLDRKFRQNTNYYQDRYSKITAFLKAYAGRLFPLSDDYNALAVSEELSPVPASRLAAKRFVFGDDKRGTSTFKGVRDFGPLSNLSREPHIFFAYRLAERELSRSLYRALRGDTFPETFPGMNRMFKLPFDTAHVSGVALEHFDHDHLAVLVAEIEKHPDRTPIVILLEPWTEDDVEYYHIKHFFLQRNTPVQFVKPSTIRDRTALKWAISNIGLQIFAKLGGQPWRVDPGSAAKSLIIGIGQAHRRSADDTTIDTFRAYTILTDASGLYRELRVLGNSTSEDAYIQTLQDNIKRVIADTAEQFDTFVLHTPFAMSRRELAAIEETIQGLTAANPDRRFIALKINDNSKFFGFQPATNSLVPLESTVVQLSKTDHLVWFEGLAASNPITFKRIGGPLLLSFFFPARSELDRDTAHTHLQEALNLSGTNWRGFHAKSLPVSVWYSKLVARFVKEFDSAGYRDFDIATLTPWFL
jgi:hypothetical protein